MVAYSIKAVAALIINAGFKNTVATEDRKAAAAPLGWRRQHLRANNSHAPWSEAEIPLCNPGVALKKSSVQHCILLRGCSAPRCCSLCAITPGWIYTSRSWTRPAATAGKGQLLLLHRQAENTLEKAQRGGKGKGICSKDLPAQSCISTCLFKPIHMAFGALPFSRKVPLPSHSPGPFWAFHKDRLLGRCSPGRNSRGL